jgi:hypothetical protein
MWMHTQSQSNITNIIFTWVHNTNTHNHILEYIDIEGTRLSSEISCANSNRLDLVVAQLVEQFVEHWTSIPKVAGHSRSAYLFTIEVDFSGQTRTSLIYLKEQNVQLVHMQSETRCEALQSTETYLGTGHKVFTRGCGGYFLGVRKNNRTSRGCTKILVL